MTQSKIKRIIIHPDRARSINNLSKAFSGFLVLERDLQFHILPNRSTFSLLVEMWMRSFPSAISLLLF